MTKYFIAFRYDDFIEIIEKEHLAEAKKSGKFDKCDFVPFSTAIKKGIISRALFNRALKEGSIFIPCNINWEKIELAADKFKSKICRIIAADMPKSRVYFESFRIERGGFIFKLNVNSASAGQAIYAKIHMSGDCVLKLQSLIIGASIPHKIMDYFRSINT